MKVFTLIFILLLINLSTMAQQTLNGEYYFRKMELVSGFYFTPEGRFEFFYSYGASDRNASGTYIIEGDTVKLKSDKEAGNDFNIDAQSKTPGNISIKVTSSNPYLSSNILCICIADGKEHEYISDNEGLINTELSRCDKIYLQHGLFPDVASLIKDEKNENNYFECSLKPSLQQVSFKGIDLFIKDDVLSCLPNYFLPIEGIEFEKGE